MIDYPINNYKKLNTSSSYEDRNILYDTLGISLIILSGILFTSFISMDTSETSILSLNTKNILGPLGAYISSSLFFVFGYSSYFIALFSIILGLYFIIKNNNIDYIKTSLVFVLPLVSFSILFDVLVKQNESYKSGGVLGSAINHIIKIDTLSIVISTAMLIMSIVILMKNATLKKYFPITGRKKVDNNLAKSIDREKYREEYKKENIDVKASLKNKIVNSIFSKDNHENIPFISVKTFDENDNKKFVDIKNFKSAIEKDLDTFENNYNNSANIVEEKGNKPSKNINNIYRDAFKKENKRYSEDVGLALSQAVYSDNSFKSSIDDVLDTYDNANTFNKSISPEVLYNTVPMTLDELIKKNKIKKTYTQLNNIYSSTNTDNKVEENIVVEKTITETNNNSEVKKLILDYEVSIDNNKNNNIESIDYNNIESNKKEDLDINNDIKNIAEERNNIFEFEVSRTANKPYKREDHFPPTTPEHRIKPEIINLNNNIEKVYIKDIEPPREHIEKNNYIDNSYIENEKDIPNIEINNSKNKLRIDIVESENNNSQDSEEFIASKYLDDDNEKENNIDLANYIEDIESDNNIETKNNEVELEYKKSIEDITINNGDYNNETEERENSVQINNIDFAVELEREREKEREKIKSIIADNIELPRVKNIKKIERNIDDDYIQTNYDRKYIDKNYVKPPLELLERVIHVDDSNAITAIKQTALQLENTLLDFGIEAKVTGVSRGPVVTRYELELSSGTRVSKIVNLTDNIALALASESVRIIAPIPGRSVIGIEIPNKIRTQVSLREILESADFKTSKKDIPFVLGKGIYGNNVITDLSEAPHLLVAGTTGSGKSVCLSTIILSMLFRFRPDELKFIFIDKKRVELSIYNGIPHLMSPVVSDEKKATVVLRHIVDIMERRYERMEKFFVRNVKAYNEKVSKLIKDGEREFEGEPLELFPYIVVVIDELHNLMVVSSKEVEDLISRLAGMSRAVGIHLVIATQRPSADVVTGIIKANLPTRIAFQVPNKTNSRIIIDMAGAEQLLGKGDGLFCSSGSQMPERVQGAFVSDAEVKKVADFLSNSIEPVYDEALISALDKNDNDTKDTDDEDILDEELWSDAINIVARTRKASASFLQRRLKIGYNRAARIVEIMERQGLVGPENGSKPREVLIDSDYN